MHDQARAGFQSMAARIGLPTGRYLDLGGYDVNGTVWDLLPPGSVVTVLDYRGGPAVDIVADARTWRLDGRDPFDAVISTELLEHVAPIADEVAEGWALVVATAYAALAPGGVFVGTCASNGRSPHAADGASSPHPSEHYGNVDPDDLRHVLLAVGFTDVTVTYQAHPGDVYWCARKGTSC